MNNRTNLNRTAVIQSLGKFLPPHFVEYVTDIFLASRVRLSIVRSRKSKLGDFRAGIGNEKHKITINGDLNPYSFLVTTLHEFAHLNTFNKFGRSVQPHGTEWKTEFKRLLLPVIDSKELPSDIENALLNSLVNMKASSCSDQQLYRVLVKYNSGQNKILLEEIPSNSVFLLNGKEYIKGPLRRKRYVCQEVCTNKSYLVNSLAQVSIKDN